MDREIIHVLPQEYIVDEQDGIREPLGMAGVRLEAKVHIVTAAVSSAQNIVKCCNRCGLQVADIVLEPLAAAESVLHDDEKELGVALVDIGGGTTDVAIFNDGAIVHSAVLPLGGNHITHAIAVGLRTPLDSAEKIKQRSGVALASLVNPGDTIQVPSVGGRQPRELARQVLCDIVMPRVEEILEHVRRELVKSGQEELLASGLVLTGGAVNLEGTVELAEEVLGLPARRGIPRGIGGLVDVVKSPAYATGVGLVLHGARRRGRPVVRGTALGLAVTDRGVWQRMTGWFREIF
jgi:cell division protein FtsA